MVKVNLVKIIAIILISGFVASCSVPSEPIKLADNEKGYRITCGGAYSHISECYEKAGYICGNKGYSVVHETNITPPGDSNYFWNAAAHETVIKCNAHSGDNDPQPLR